ncbi:FxsA family protein [Bacillus licheniformis]|nr:FxsA family protein [Bacillus licheniformis]
MKSVCSSCPLIGSVCCRPFADHLTGFLGAALAKNKESKSTTKSSAIFSTERCLGTRFGRALYFIGACCFAARFLSDIIGLLLLLPATRGRFKPFISRKLKRMSEGRRINIIK